MKNMLKKSLLDMVESCEYVPVSALVPQDWGGWFWTLVSENAPFSFGDNNRTMVDMTKFCDHVDSRLEESDFDPATWKMIEQWKAWIEGLREEADGVVYIDMEN